jgi:alkylresorcinol/alkylpyrone synthase
MLMLNAVPADASEQRRARPLDVEIAAVATAVPAHAITQEEMERRAREAYPQFARIEGLYANTGVETRYFCQPKEWYLAPRTWEERTAAFQRHALDLLERVAREAVARAGLRLDEIDAVVTNTITGLAVPSLDALLMNRMGFAPHAERLPIFGLGCGGGVGGLARASRLAQTLPGGNVLFLTIDLCSLCLRINDAAIAMYVAAALFADGAAAVVLRNTQRSTGGIRPLGRIVATGEHFWPETEHIMGWDIKNDGFGIVLSPQLPALLRDNLGAAIDGFLARNGLTRDDLDGFLFHPGGGKIIDVAERVLGLAADALEPSRRILRDYGNMSSATALFVLEEALASGRRGRHLLAAFGPGFSAYFAVIDL